MNTLFSTKLINFFISSNVAFPLFTKKFECFSEIQASPNLLSSGTDSLINSHTFFLVPLIMNLKVESLQFYVLHNKFDDFSFLYHSCYTTIEAKFATLGHFSVASAATGPLMSVPFTSPSGVIKTPALSSN